VIIPPDAVKRCAACAADEAELIAAALRQDLPLTLPSYNDTSCPSPSRQRDPRAPPVIGRRRDAFSHRRDPYLFLRSARPVRSSAGLSGTTGPPH
jgi:hypothetical protein